MKKVTKWVLALTVLLTVLILPLLGGNAIDLLKGAYQLDVDGSAPPHDAAGAYAAVPSGWAHYGGDAGGNRYSALTQINQDNVTALEPAWTFSTGDMADKPEAMRRSASEATPIMVDGRLIFCTPFNEVIALDPGTGTPLWRFDPKINLQQQPANQFVCRGVAHWQDSEATGACASRIFMGTNDGRLIALNAESGELCLDFGQQGEVRIDPGMELWWPGEFQFTSPPVVADDTVIVGSSISDNARADAPLGTVRAYDVRSGQARWEFDPLDREGRSDMVAGHANVWAPMSVDEQRGWVFLPTSSPSPDFFGGLRPGNNEHANSVVAVNAANGEIAWSFQTVHHDVWDYDLASQPGLYRVWRDNEFHEVVAQVTKTGLVFVLDRETGKPFLPIEEKAFPQSPVAGEWLSPTQPVPTATPALVPNHLRPSDAFGVTAFDRWGCARAINNARSEGLFTPPSEQGTILYPFTGGGANWGSAAFDPARNLLVVNMSVLAHHIQLIPSADYEEAREVFHDQEVSPQSGTAYAMKRETLLSALNLPCNTPPWGVIAGVNLASGELVWRRTLGTTEDLGPVPGIELGTPNSGGPIITAGGLIFIGATMDYYLRALDVESGRELWRGRLPAGPQATPMTYQYQGRQFVVIFAGGNARMGTALGDTLTAFALPRA